MTSREVCAGADLCSLSPRGSLPHPPGLGVGAGGWPREVGLGACLSTLPGHGHSALVLSAAYHRAWMREEQASTGDLRLQLDLVLQTPSFPRHHPPHHHQSSSFSARSAWIELTAQQRTRTGRVQQAPGSEVPFLSAPLRLQTTRRVACWVYTDPNPTPDHPVFKMLPNTLFCVVWGHMSSCL